MDQGPLVGEQIEAGAELAREFHRRFPLRAAFWLKESGVEDWLLHLASDQVNDINSTEAHREVRRLRAGKSRVWLDTSSVRVSGTGTPLVKAVTELQHQDPDPHGHRTRSCRMGNVTVEDMYIYPLPLPDHNRPDR